ncbi:MAG: hypothetical protein N4A76_01215 [Firmicutes bacterium]|nr:hypothetical protein [Bacillota bacterium]
MNDSVSNLMYQENNVLVEIGFDSRIIKVICESNDNIYSNYKGMGMEEFFPEDALISVLKLCVDSIVLGKCQYGRCEVEEKSSKMIDIKAMSTDKGILLFLNSTSI